MNTSIFIVEGVGLTAKGYAALKSMKPSVARVMILLFEVASFLSYAAGAAAFAAAGYLLGRGP